MRGLAWWVSIGTDLHGVHSWAQKNLNRHENGPIRDLIMGILLRGRNGLYGLHHRLHTWHIMGSMAYVHHPPSSPGT